MKTDERIRLMNEIICGVQVIKMYAWEKPFAKLIAYARKMELKSVRITSYARGLQMILLLFTQRCALFCTMVGIVFIDGPEFITAARVFAIAPFLQRASTLMSQRFSRSVGETAEVLISLKRLENFLNMEEKPSSNSIKCDDQNKKRSSSNEGKVSAVSLILFRLEIGNNWGRNGIVFVFCEYFRSARGKSRLHCNA